MSCTYCKLLHFTNCTIKIVQIAKCMVDYMLKKVDFMLKHFEKCIEHYTQCFWPQNVQNFFKSLQYVQYSL